MKNHLAFLFLVFISAKTFSQIPSTGDCINAIAICTVDYHQTEAATGAGNILNEIDTATSCLLEGEQDDTWYQLYTIDSGYLTFLILPDSSGDYDFDMYNMNGMVCDDIFESSGAEVSCNWAASTDSTGAILNGDTSWQDEYGSAFNTVVHVQQNTLYTLVINHYQGFQAGYHIDFSGSTALFVAPPVVITVDSNILHSSMYGHHYQWFLNGNPLPGDTLKDLTAPAFGLYNVAVTYFGGCLVTSSFFNYNLNFAGNIIYNNEFNIFPNPSNGNFELSFGLIQNSPVKIELYNAIGQLQKVLTDENFSSGNQKITFNSNELNLSSGVYLLKLTVNGNSVWTKAVFE